TSPTSSSLHIGQPPLTTLFPYTTLFRSGRSAPLRKGWARRTSFGGRGHDDLAGRNPGNVSQTSAAPVHRGIAELAAIPRCTGAADRKSTRLNSSHDQISYAVFCLKKKRT